MGANNHQLYFSSPDSTSSRSSSSSLLKKSETIATSKSFLISDILKPTFGHPNDKSSIDFSPSITHHFDSSLETSFKSEILPAWIYCTRYSDRPSAGPRIRKLKGYEEINSKRPRTAFTNNQLARLKNEFEHSKYLTGERRQILAHELGLNETQIKIWYQNKRAKLKRSSGIKNTLALQLMAQGLYNHTSSINKDI